MFGELILGPYPDVEPAEPMGAAWFKPEALDAIVGPPLAPEINAFVLTMTRTAQSETAGRLPAPDAYVHSPDVILQIGIVPGRSLRCWYVNWKGEREDRFIAPRHIWFGTSKYHPALQWFMHVQDLDKCVERDFAITSMGNVRYV